MNIKDKFRFIRQNIKKNRVRTFMTILATAMGCAFLIVLASVGYGLHQSFVKDTLEDQIVTQIEIYGKEKDDTYRSLTISDIEELEKIDRVKAVTRKNELRQIPIFTVDNYKGETLAVSVDYPSEIASGLELEKGRLPENDNEVVVGYHFKEYLFPETDEDIYDQETGKVKEEYLYKDDIIGKKVEMTVSKDLEGKVTENIPLTIVGVMEKPTKDWEVDQSVYISGEVYKQVESFTGTPSGELGIESDQVHTDTFDSVNVYADNLEAVESIVDVLEEDNYATYSVVSEMEQINVVFTIAKAGLILVGTIALIIASIGIYNTMTMAVTERAPDIGIMKAIGANPKTIKQIFLLESSYIGLMGAFIGTVVAYATSALVNVGLPLIIETVFEDELPEGLQFSAIPWSLVVISVVICLIVTILSGMRPAKRATQIDVLKAMRREV